MTGENMTEHEKAKAAQRELSRRRMQDPAYRVRKKATQTAYLARLYDRMQAEKNDLTALKQEQKEKKYECNGTHH